MNVNILLSISPFCTNDLKGKLYWSWVDWLPIACFILIIYIIQIVKYIMIKAIIIETIYYIYYFQKSIEAYIITTAITPFSSQK